MAAVVCQTCGGKTKAERLRCPRCGEILETAVPVDPATGLRALYLRHRGPLVVAGAILSVILLLAVIARQPDPASEAAAPAASVKPAPAVAPTLAPAAPDPGFLDPKTGGSSAYRAGDYVSSLEHFKNAVSTNPDDGDSLNNLGQLLARNGDPAAAIPHLEKAARLYPAVWAYRFNLAHAHGQLGNWSQAVEDYKRARSLFPDDYVTQFNLGMALHNSGDEEAAVSELRKGAELAPAEPSFHLSLGISYEQLNRVDDAVTSYERYLALSPSASDADKVKARIEQLRKPA